MSNIYMGPAQTPEANPTHESQETSLSKQLEARAARVPHVGRQTSELRANEGRVTIVCPCGVYHCLCCIWLESSIALWERYAI